MLEFRDKCAINIDSAMSSKNSTGWTTLKNKTKKTQLLHFRTINHSESVTESS